MAVSNKNKKVVQRAEPGGKHIVQGGDPNRYYLEYPAWSFEDADKELWAFTQEHIGDLFWDEILPRMRALETQQWQEILVAGKKENHSISAGDLSTVAQTRLADRHIEAESILSLRVTGTHRLYGYMVRQVFHLLWVDLEHGDNSKCVCRSHKKHT